MIDLYGCWDYALSLNWILYNMNKNQARVYKNYAMILIKNNIYYIIRKVIKMIEY